MWARAGADHSDMSIAQRPLPVLVIKHEDAGEGEIALTPAIFSEGPAPVAWPFRQVQLGDDLVRLAECRQRPGEKIAGAYRARSGRAEEGDFPFAGHRDAGQFGGRVDMGKTAPDGATVADLVMRDMRDGRVQQRMRRHQPLIVLNVAPACEQGLRLAAQAALDE